MPISSTSSAVEAASSPITLRCPPSGAASTSAARRRLRAATALLTLAEKTAGNPYLPTEEREHALKEAQRHLNAAWFFLVSWSTEDSSFRGPSGLLMTELITSRSRGVRRPREAIRST